MNVSGFQNIFNVDTSLHVLEKYIFKNPKNIFVPFANQSRISDKITYKDRDFRENSSRLIDRFVFSTVKSARVIINSKRGR